MAPDTVTSMGPCVLPWEAQQIFHITGKKSLLGKVSGTVIASVQEEVLVCGMHVPQEALQLSLAHLLTQEVVMYTKQPRPDAIVMVLPFRAFVNQRRTSTPYGSLESSIPVNQGKKSERDTEQGQEERG